MRRRSLVRQSAAIGALGLAGCTQNGSDPDDSPGDTTRTPDQTSTDSTGHQSGTPSDELCASIDGVTFESVEEQPGGPGPDGTAAQSHWSVSFDDGNFEYSHTDVVESGTYTCAVDDGVAALTADAGSNRALNGTYDPETGVLEWDGVRYRPV